MGLNIGQVLLSSKLPIYVSNTLNYTYTCMYVSIKIADSTNITLRFIIINTQLL